MALDALSAGKDVYIEKPMTFTVDEGLEIIAAADRHKRIFQVGSQGVSGARQAAAREHGQVRAARRDHDDPRLQPPELRQRRLALPDSAGRLAADGRLEAVPRPGARRSRSASSASSGGAATGTIPAASPPTCSSTSSAGSTSSWTCQAPSHIQGAGGTFVRKTTHEVPDTLVGTLTYPEGFTVQLSCTLNSQAGSASGIEILGSKASLRLRGDDVFLDEERIDQGGNGWVVRSWPEALEKAYYADPAVRAREIPDSRRQERVSGGEHWSIVGEDDIVTHVRVFLEAVKVDDSRSSRTRASAIAPRPRRT